MTAKTAIIIILSLFLISCDQQPETDWESKGGYDYFTLGDMRTAADLRRRALEGTEAYAILEDLVTTAPSRLPGGPDDAAAVAWAVAKMEELGFDRVWTEPVTFQGWARDFAVAEVTSHAPMAFNITSLGKSASTPEGGVTAEVVHFATYADLAAADASEVEGKIVFISNRMERASDGSGYRPAVVARARGHAMVAKLGGLALIIRSIGTDDSDNPHTGAMTFSNDGVAEALKIPGEEDAWSIKDGEKTVAAGALSNQDADQLQALFEAGEVVEMLVDIQNLDLGEITTYNVIGDITGSERPDEIIITGGHLDAWDLGVGAVDDGTGVAITMAAVAMIGDLPEAPARTIRMVAFAAEEVGLHGGFAYAAAHADEMDKHIFGIESEFGVGKLLKLTPAVDEAAIPVLREIWRLMGPMGIEWNPDAQGFPGPDLIPMLRAGLVGASLNGDGTYYFDFHHTAADQLEAVSPESLNFNVAAYAALLYMTSQYEGRFDGKDTDSEEN